MEILIAFGIILVLAAIVFAVRYWTRPVPSRRIGEPAPPEIAAERERRARER